MGVHTGDSITVAPAQTLTDKEYQRMRDAAIAIMRAVGVETGGSQRAVRRESRHGEMIVVEMNPRVSRAARRWRQGDGLPDREDRREARGRLHARRDPQRHHAHDARVLRADIDYVVTKIPRWTFEKFPEADETLTTQMKSVGEAMAIGRTFKESVPEGHPLDGGQAVRARPRRTTSGSPRRAARGETVAPQPTFRKPRRAHRTGSPSIEEKLRRKLACRARAGCTTSATR
jgi:hypothetical protein